MTTAIFWDARSKSWKPHFRCALLFLGDFFFKYYTAPQKLFETMSTFQGFQEVWKGVR